MNRTLDQLLTTLEVDPNAFSVCRIQTGWRMTFPAFDAVTIHFVLRGSGHLQVGASPPISFAPSSVLIVPTSEKHWVGDVGDHATVCEAADRCALLGDGLIEFTAGSGANDTLMLCGALPAPYQGGLGFFDLLRAPVAGDMVAGVIPASVFDAMTNRPPVRFRQRQPSRPSVACSNSNIWATTSGRSAAHHRLVGSRAAAVNGGS